MIRFLFIITLIISFSIAKDDINKKIKVTSKTLNSYKTKKSLISAKMSKNADAILAQKIIIKKQEQHLKELQDELKEKETVYKDDGIQLKKFKIIQNNTKANKDKIEQELVFTIARSVSLSVVLQEQYSANAESIIELEVLKKMLIQSKDKVKTLNKSFFKISKEYKSIKEHSSKLETAIAKIDAKRRDLLQTQKNNKKSLQKLQVAKSSYKKEFKKVLKKQDSLKKTLSKLNIIKIDLAKKAREEKSRKEAFKSNSYVSDKNIKNVKKHGSSYQEVETRRYRGPKTIPPLSHYTITKRYGAYKDPIYGIKVFNESISLKPKISNSKVKTVFNGKVIYADKTAMLDNLVIMEHRNGLHTIYANLSQIAPTIKVGKKIKKGYTIGRVKEELIFEVTQKNYHINPIRLFK